MIKKLHYVWFGGNSIPPNVNDCIESWKRNLPDWEIVQWNESNFDINKYRWVREAIAQKKYAFAADFVRLYVLDKFGGAYLDTDVQILRNIEPLLKSTMVCGIQNHRFGTQMLNHVTELGIDTTTGCRATWFCVQAGFFYAEPNHPFVRHCLDVMYENGNRPFLKENGETNQFVIDWKMMAELTKFGAVYRDKNQYVKDLGLMLYNSSVFATRKSKNKDSYLIHWFDQSWKPAKTVKQRIVRFIKKNMFFLFRKI